MLRAVILASYHLWYKDLFVSNLTRQIFQLSSHFNETAEQIVRYYPLIMAAELLPGTFLAYLRPTECEVKQC